MAIMPTDEKVARPAPGPVAPLCAVQGQYAANPARLPLDEEDRRRHQRRRRRSPRVLSGRLLPLAPHTVTQSPDHKPLPPGEYTQGRLCEREPIRILSPGLAEKVILIVTRASISFSGSRTPSASGRYSITAETELMTGLLSWVIMDLSRGRTSAHPSTHPALVYRLGVLR